MTADLEAALERRLAEIGLEARESASPVLSPPEPPARAPAPPNRRESASSPRRSLRAIVRALPPAQTDVLRGLLRGRSLEAVAGERGRSFETVNNQARDLYRRFGVSSRYELLALFVAPSWAKELQR